MTPRLVYLSGEPGVGKSTLMADLTDGWSRVPEPGVRGSAPARDWLYEPRTGAVVAVELGRRRDAFAGTDALPSSAVIEAERYVRSGQAASEAPLLLAEGARLACRRFLVGAVDAGYRVTLVHLYGSALAAHRRRERAALLGKREQSEPWVRGRATAARNLANAAPGWGVHVVTVNVEAIAAEGDDGPTARSIVREWALALGADT